ncbi:MAG: DUF2007 domain-containing protein [Alistipes sp.]|nr:DUF2007 domain-containing protein [Alistipes sp.]
MEENGVIVIGSFNSVDEARIYKALLESAGVPARLQNDIAAQIIPAYGDMMEVNLLVAVEDQQRALEILNAGFDQGEFDKECEAELCDGCEP